MTALTIIIFAAATNANANPLKRLKNGSLELVTAPLEVGQKTAYYSKNLESPILGAAGGILEGTATMTIQAVSGLVKIITFPFNPDVIGYEQ